MKICCFIDSLVSGGAQRQLVNLAILLKRQGHDITFVVYRDDYFYKSFLDAENIRLVYIENTNPVNRIFRIRSFFKQYDGEIVISFLETPNFISCISAIGNRKWKLITNELSAKEKSFTSRRSKFFKLFEIFSDWTVCNSDNARNMWIYYYPKFQNRVSTIYNPIIIPHIEPDGVKSVNNRRRIVIAASYQYLKNPINLVKAVHLLDDDKKNRLQIDWYGRKEVETGDTRAYDEALQLVYIYNLNDVINFYGETTNIYNEMCNSDAVALFSTVEGLPNAICEGMMLEKPIIMSRVSDYNRLVTCDNGFLCDPYSVVSIKDALIAFLDKSDFDLQEMGKESKRIAEVLFSPIIVINQWERLFEKIK